jgi:hexaprenyl-diphosphate synthase
MSQATNGLAPGFEERKRMELSGQKQGDSSRGIDEPLEDREDILNDANPSITASTSTFPASSNVLPSQRRLAEITEMIHVASLLHDDVIDNSDTRRSQPSAPSAFGNKISILGGDFLLARASLYLSRLGSNEVVELVASVLANLVEGEVMQIKGNTPESSGQKAAKLTPEIFEHYMKKTYLKTASLIAKSTRATTVLGGAGEKQGGVEGERIKDIAYAYGRNLGIAFQVSRPYS